jgi:hypothetical protein
VPQQARKWSAVSRPKVTLGDFIIPTVNRFKALEPNESCNSHVFLGNSAERRLPTCSDIKHNPTTVEHGRKVCADGTTTTVEHGRKVCADGGSDILAPLEYEDDDLEINAAEEELTIFVTADSGAVAHVTPPETVPRGAVIDSSAVRGNFVAANGTRIINHGKTAVSLVSEGKSLNSNFQVADTNRTLHSTGQTCDAGHEVLYMAKGAVVVKAGTLSRFLDNKDVIVKYPRPEKGLYMAEMKIRAPRMLAKKNEAADFPRQGAAR